MTTPKRNEAVSVRRYGWSKDGMRISADGGFVFSPDHDAAIDALQGEVSRLRAASEADSAYLRHLISAISAFKGKRGAFMALGAQDARTVRLWELLNNLEPPTDGR